MKNLFIIFLFFFSSNLFAQLDQCAKCQECLPLAKEVQKNASEYEQIKTAINTTSDPDQKSKLNVRLNNNRNHARQLQDKLSDTGCWGYVKLKKL